LYSQALSSGSAATSDSLYLKLGVNRALLDSTVYKILEYYTYNQVTKDTLRLWTSRYDRKEAEYLIARDYIQDNNVQAADSILSLVPLKFSLDAAATADLAALRTMLPILAGKDLYQLDTATLQALAVYDDSALVYTADLARAIRMGNGIIVPIRYVLPQGALERNSWKETGYKPEMQTNGYGFYPNPADNALTVTYPVTKVDLRLEVYDLLGKLVQTVVLPLGSRMTSVDTGNFHEGVHILKVSNGAHVLATQKVVINH
jgi:hypothetical protein